MIDDDDWLAAVLVLYARDQNGKELTNSHRCLAPAAKGTCFTTDHVVIETMSKNYLRLRHQKGRDDC